jgi:hypothetical protein
MREFDDYGWISPDGDFIGCKRYEHDEIATILYSIGLTMEKLRLGIDGYLEDYIHVSLNEFLFDFKYKLNQSQIDIIFDYATSKNYNELILNGKHKTIKQIMDDNDAKI